MKREVELARKLLEGKGYNVSRKMREGYYNHSGWDVSDDLQQYAVTVVIGGTDGDCENGMCEPDYYVEIVSAMDEGDARRQVKQGLNPGDGITDVHIASEQEISDWYRDAYDNTTPDDWNVYKESKKSTNEHIEVSAGSNRDVITNKLKEKYGKKVTLGTLERVPNRDKGTHEAFYVKGYYKDPHGKVSHIAELVYVDHESTNEHIEVAMNGDSTTAEKVAYAKKMLDKLKHEWDDHYAYDLVDFLNGSSLLNEIPIDESKLSDDTDDEHAESEQGRVPRPKRGRKSNGDLKDDGVFTPGSREERLAKKKMKESIRRRMQESDTIYITKPDDLVGMPSPKFRVTYSTAKGETTSMTIQATDENSAKAIIQGRCRRRGKTPKFISIEKISESKIQESTDEYGRSLAELPASDPLCAELRSLGLTEKDIDPVASSDKYHEYHGSDFHHIPIRYKDLEAHGYEYVDTNSSDYTSGSMINFKKGYMVTLVASSTGFVHIQKLGPTALEKIKSGTFDFWNDRYSE